MALPAASVPQPRPRFPRWILWALAGSAAIFITAVGRPHLALQAQRHHALNARALDTDQLEALLGLSGDHAAILRDLWATGRVPHRRVVLHHLLQHRADHPELARPWILEAAQDPDAALRELALGSLPPGDSPEAGALLHPQLVDPDPDLRLQALHTLRRAGHPGWTPWILPLALDSEGTLALAADALLRRWTGIDSGLRFASLEGDPTPSRSTPLTDAQRAQLLAVQQQRMRWWAEHGASHPSPFPSSGPTAPRLAPRPVPEWSLPDLDGRMRSLAEFRGRLVLLNFWATWCAPCLHELPTLVELQAEMGTNQLVVLGVCLDAPAAPPPQDTPASSSSSHARAVRLVAQRHRLNYPVLLDPTQQVGPQFDGQELPTQVLIDRQGRLVRRFLGPRSLATWKALLAHADSPDLQRRTAMPIH